MRPSGLLSLFMVLLLPAGCSRQEQAADLTPEEGYVMVTDFLDQQIKVKQDPERVGCLFAVASHIVAMLGEADAIIMVPQGNRRDLLFCEIFPTIGKARVVKGNNAVNIEEIARKPRAEVFFANPEVTLDEGQVRQLSKLKTPVVTIAFADMHELMEMIRLVGKIIGKEQKAEAYVRYCTDIMTLVAERIGNIPHGQKQTVYHSINELLRTDQHNSLSKDWIDRIGVKNVAFTERTDGGFTLNKNYMQLEELFERNPDHIIINGADVLDYIESNPQLHNLKAYRTGNIHLLPLGITRWGHPYSIETPLAMLWTAKTIYPDHFKDVDMDQKTRDFYRDFFEYELSDFQLKKILSGRGYKEIKGSGR